MGYYKLVRGRSRLSKQIRRTKNKGKRLDFACGLIGLIGVGLGAAAGGWGGAAIGGIIGGLIINYICKNPNP